SVYAICTFWLLTTGIYNLGIHQLEDYDNDNKINVTTWAVKLEKLNVQKWCLGYIWTLKMFSFLFFSIVLFMYSPLAGVVLSLIILLKITVVFFDKGIKSHYSDITVNYLQQINIHYHLWMPYLFLIILTFDNVF